MVLDDDDNDDKIIGMDNGSGLADRSDELVNFLKFLEHTDWLAYTFFTLYIRQDETCKW